MAKINFNDGTDAIGEAGIAGAGRGKTTTAFNIAIIARAAGLRVGLLDSDP